MKNIVFVREKHEEAKRWSGEVIKSLEKIEFFLQNDLISGVEFPWNLVEMDAQEAYISALETALKVQEIMYEMDCDFGQNFLRKSNENGGEVIASEVAYDERTGAVTCKIMAPPVLKKRAAVGRYLDLVCLELQRKILEKLPPKFKNLEAAYVVFVNHFSKKLTGKQPYFDNDNLAIKGLLDAIVPLVCADDAFVYCDNLYLAQQDRCTFSEVIIVPKERLWAWLQTRPELNFSKEFYGK